MMAVRMFEAGLANRANQSPSRFTNTLRVRRVPSRRYIGPRSWRRRSSLAPDTTRVAPAGYAVFSVNYRLAPKYPYPYMAYDVERSVRYLRHNAKKWNVDPNRIALVSGSAGGFLSNE